MENSAAHKSSLQVELYGLETDGMVDTKKTLRIPSHFGDAAASPCKGPNGYKNCSRRQQGSRNNGFVPLYASIEINPDGVGVGV
jgi:hypothetical protein